MTELQTDLLHEIWKAFPFSKSTVHAVFLRHKSIDKTIKVLESAKKAGINPLSITKITQK